MKTLILTTAAVLAATSAHAAPPFAEHYFGLNLATPGEANFAINGRSVPSENHPRALKIYGGLQFTPTWAAELGYGDFGTWRAATTAPGSAHRAEITSQVAYAAARGTLPLGDSFAAFSKVGLAVNRVNMHDSAGHSRSETYVRPMAGVGLEWKITTQVSATVEYAHYGARGKGNDRVTQQKAEAGLVFKF